MVLGHLSDNLREFIEDGIEDFLETVLEHYFNNFNNIFTLSFLRRLKVSDLRFRTISRIHHQTLSLSLVITSTSYLFR